jgi:DNA-binding SARP family transcriptional activator/tetratricopeptide (TPR) repeat protein
VEALLLGRLELRQDGDPVDLGDRLQQLMLVVLLLQANRPVSDDRLIEIVWRGNRGKTSPVAHYASRIRKALRAANAPATIDRELDGYVLRIDPADIDVRRFERLCDEAAAANRAGEEERQLALLRQAVGLWRGPFLDGLDIDRVGGETVVSPEARYLDAIADLAELEIERGEHRRARDRLQDVVATHPTQVVLVGLLMRALVANGDPVRALEVYRRTRAALDEHGIEPVAELRRLMLLAQRDMPVSELPMPRGPLLGRSGELEAIRAAVLDAERDGAPALVWISGAPGIGKSKLALTAGRQLGRSFPDYQIMVDLHGSSVNVAPLSPGEALGELLKSLGVPAEQIPATVEERRREYQRILASSKALVLLDNAESEQQVQDLLPTAPGCAGLVTSRRAGGIGTGFALRLEPVDPDSARRLFERLVGSARVRDRQRLDEVLGWCGGIPMAICVVAAQFHRHQRWTLEYLAQLLRHDSRVPGSPFGEVDAAVGMSYRQLSDQQRRMFRLLATLPGPDVTIAAAAALAGCSVAGARALLDDLYLVSLVDETEPGRYRVLDPLKEYAAAIEPASPGEADEARDALLDFQLVTTAAAMRAAFPFDSSRQPEVSRTSAVALEFGDAGAARAWLSAERWNLSAAIRSAAERGRTEHVWQLAVLLWRWHYARAQVADWMQALELAERILDVPGGDRSGLAYVRLRLSGARWAGGDYPAAQELARRALDMWRDLGDEAGEASAFMALALAEIRSGDHDRAIEHLQAALARYGRLDDDRGRAYALSNLGYLYETRDELELAVRGQAEAVEVFERLGHLQGLAHAVENLACVRELRGDLDGAERDHQRASELAVELGDVSAQAYAVNGLGNVARLRGRADQALRLHEQARVLADQVSDPGLRAQLYFDRAETFFALADLDAAGTAYLSALDLSKEHAVRARAALGAARVFHLRNRCADAAEHWRSAVAAYAELGLRDAGDIRAEYERLTCECRA